MHAMHACYACISSICCDYTASYCYSLVKEKNKKKMFPLRDKNIIYLIIVFQNGKTNDKANLLLLLLFLNSSLKSIIQITQVYKHRLHVLMGFRKNEK